MTDAEMRRINKALADAGIPTIRAVSAAGFVMREVAAGRHPNAVDVSRHLKVSVGEAIKVVDTCVRLGLLSADPGHEAP